MQITKAQQRALKAVYDRHPLKESYLSFRRRVAPYPADSCIMIEWCGMWLGIETDGYTHS